MIKQNEILNKFKELYDVLYIIDKRNLFQRKEDICLTVILDALNDVGEKIIDGSMLEYDVSEFIIALQEFIRQTPYFEQTKEICCNLNQYSIILENYFFNKSKIILNKLYLKQPLNKKEKKISRYIINHYGNLTDKEYEIIKNYIESIS